MLLNFRFKKKSVTGNCNLSPDFILMISVLLVCWKNTSPTPDWSGDYWPSPSYQTCLVRPKYSLYTRPVWWLLVFTFSPDRSGVVQPDSIRCPPLGGESLFCLGPGQKWPPKNAKFSPKPQKISPFFHVIGWSLVGLHQTGLVRRW